MFCTNCGTSNQDDAAFCIHCAESLSEVQIEEKPPRTGAFKDASYLRKVNSFRALFDLSFNRFVIPKIMKFLYGLSILSAALIALLFVIIGFKTSMWFGIFALFIGAPLIFLLTVIYSRVLLEMILVIFRMADHLSEIESVHTEEKSEPRDSIQWNV